ncbi:MAG: TRAP transporter small permease [Alphaproteobacteria bacterium]
MSPAEPTRGGDPVGRVLTWLCTGFAMAGGLILVALTIITVISVVGRKLFSAPIAGDFELVEVGCAVAIFTFLPYCQLKGGNVIVDFFTLRVPASAQRSLDALWSLVYAGIAALVAWRMLFGGIDMYRFGEQTMVLGMPRWWGFVPIVVAVALLAIVALYTAWRTMVPARDPAP